jgi:ABC-type Co2+ transport system permease subunit
VIIYLSLLVAIAGLLAYALSANPKIAEIGRLSFFAGFLAFLLLFGSHVFPLAH